MAKWTAEKKQEVLAMAETATIREASEKFGVPEGTIKRWRSELREKTEPNRKSEPKKNHEPNPDEISWIDIENEYVTDVRRKACTLEDLSKKYSIPIQTIYDQSAANKWSEKRRTYRERTKEKAREKLSEKVSSDVAVALAKHFKLSDTVIKIVEKALSDEKELYKYVEKLRTGTGPGEFKEEITYEVIESLNDGKLLNIVNALDKLQKMQRQTLCIMDEKDKQRIDLVKAKLEQGGDPGKGDSWADLVVGDDDEES